MVGAQLGGDVDGGVDATDRLVALLSADLCQALAAGRGWSTSRCVDFFGEILRTQLLGPSDVSPECFPAHR